MKNQNVLVTIIAALGFVLGLAFLGNAFKNRNKTESVISVTGLGSKTFTSDLITWSGSFTRTDFDLKMAYFNLEEDRKQIAAYLNTAGIKNNEIVFSSVYIEKLYQTKTDAEGRRLGEIFNGFKLVQSVSIESKEVAKVENLSRNITEIINKGVEFTSSSPSYFYTKLAEIKQQLIADGSKDARERAEKIADNAGSDLGKLKKATMGVIQITAPNSNEDYSYGGAFNTSSKEKEATITIKLEFEVD